MTLEVTYTTGRAAHDSSDDPEIGFWSTRIAQDSPEAIFHAGRQFQDSMGFSAQIISIKIA